MISIIIPALNEEENLTQLLNSIKSQNFKNYELILADAGSRDKTRQVAKSFGCKIVKGGLPARGKNAGEKFAKGDLLLFLDADVLLPPNCLEMAAKEFSKRNLDVAGFALIPKEGFAAKILFFLFYNLPIKILGKALPHLAMGGLVKKNIFEEAGGFDESITLAEDHFFARQAAKIGKFGIIKSTKIYTSTRRFKKDGWIITGFKYFFCELHLIFFGPPRKDLFKYNYKHLKK